MKKFAALFLSILMILCLAACGSRNNEGKNSATKPVNESTKEASGQSVKEPGESTTEELSEAPDKETEASKGKILVVYYSASGNTEEVANYIVAATGADVFKLEPAEPYSDDDLDWTNDNSRVVYEHDNPDKRDVELVASTVSDWESYDTVFIGYPIWWRIAAWPVDGFIAANDFTGKTVIPFCTSSSSGLGESGELLAKAAGTGNWLKGERFSSGVSEDIVRTWIESLGL